MTTQTEMLDWACDTFTATTALDRKERAMRFLEEAIELAQALGVDSHKVHAMTVRVYDGMRGDVQKELGQAGMTLAILAETEGLWLEGEINREFDRVKSIPKDEWDRRHAAKVAKGLAK